MRPSSPASCSARSIAPGRASASAMCRRCSSGPSDDRVVQRGHDKLSVFGIVGEDEARLLQPVSRALQARGSLVATEHGGLRLAGDARAILKGEQGARDRPSAEVRARAADGRAGQPPTRSAIRCSMRCASCAANWRPRRRSRPTSSSTTPRCAKWRPSGRPAWPKWGRSRAWERRSSKPTARRSCRWCGSTRC